ncbi:BTB/POZ domain-containing protein POB1-like [Solanum dulcamara]|uniref:BTB/POZ domain-containing protein POB1-like n=1 Tax=Solanum dulcamara TaxID=45834 RepID=UPI0024867F7D|nr:BTB/POZ domain-containing protein POB1-like [Solanum dulcamara]
MPEELPSGIVRTKNHPLHVRTIHISSLILAAKSPFFKKLFSNGAEVSEQRRVTVQIHESEEAAFIDLLKFMYCNTLSTTTSTGLLDVLMAGDKFEVVSCMRYCSNVLQTLHMTTELAVLYLDLPSKISMADAVQPLTDAAKLFLVLRFRDITRFQEEALSLPLSGIKVVLSSDDLQSASEDAVYDFALKWARKHYSKLEERRKVWTSHLCNLIRFPFMTCMKLKKIMTSNDFGTELAKKLVLEALFYKAEAPYQQRAIAATVGDAVRHRYVERAYKFRPVKTLEFETPHQQCVVYLDLKRDECAILFPAGKVYSEGFHLGGREFFLSAHCNMDLQGAFHCLGLFLGMQGESEPVAVDHEFSVRMGPDNEYVSKHKGNYTLTSGVVVGCRNLCGVAWTPFLDVDSLYFVDGILHLRAELTIRE